MDPHRPGYPQEPPRHTMERPPVSAMMPESNGFLVRPKLYSSGGLIPLRSAALADDKMLAAAEAEGLKEDLLSLASSTQRGFKASREERRRAKNLAEALEKLNPTESD